MRLLIEIYTEEIPASYMPGILRFARKFFRDSLRTKLEVMGTCRRIVIYAPGLAGEITGLSNLLEEFVEKVPLPKRMRWDNSGMSFARPIRNLLVLQDSRLVEGVTIGALSVSNFTFFLNGDSFLKEPKEVSGIDDYFEFLRSLNILLSPEERRQFILKELNRIAHQKGCSPNVEESLLEELVYLTECPCLFLGTFDAKFLELPSEVLVTSMARNQKLFTLSYEDGRMAPFFVGILEGQGRLGFDYSHIVDRVEAVLEAKLSDAYFFWHQDCEVDLKERTKALEKVVVHTDIGTLLNKIEKMIDLIDVAKDELNLEPDEFENLKTAAYLCKADLETLMVYEFPELEGIMGYYYALRQGYPEQVAVAIKEHYMPKTAEDELPSSKLGRILSLIERLTSVTAYFRAGLKPTGNEDPYGVRRSVLTLIKLVFSMKEPVNLDILFKQSIKLWDCQQELLEDIRDYFHDRVINFLSQRGIRRDISEAVWRRWGLDLQKLWKVAKDLNAMAKSLEFREALKVIERTYKITKKAPAILPKVDEALFSEPEEKNLWVKFSSLREEFKKLVEACKIKDAVALYSRLAKPLHEFFDKVMVNVEDKPLRENRLSMLREINRLFGDNIAVFY